MDEKTTYHTRWCSGVTKIENVAYFSSLMDRFTPRLKVIFSLRYHPLQTVLSGRRVFSIKSNIFINEKKLKIWAGFFWCVFFTLLSTIFVLRFYKFKLRYFINFIVLYLLPKSPIQVYIFNICLVNKTDIDQLKAWYS